MRNSVYSGSSSHMLWAPVEICRGDPKVIKNAVQSYPSGHTGTAFTVMIFLSLYLNAKFKAFADFNTGFWKMLAVMSPVMAAIFTSGTLFIDRVSPDLNLGGGSFTRIVLCLYCALWLLLLATG